MISTSGRYSSAAPVWMYRLGEMLKSFLAISSTGTIRLYLSSSRQAMKVSAMRAIASSAR